MKVLLINGSPNKNGCTYVALSEVLSTLKSEGIDGEIVHIGKLQQGCIGCKACKGTGRCAFGNEDGLNDLLEKAESADGFIIGSPVHFASASGMITSFMDRFFMAVQNISYKPGAAIVSCRRGGATAALDQLNKYFTIRNMPLVSSNYWNMVHGSTPDDVKKDEEGIQTMRILGKNMAWILKCIDAGKNNGVSYPKQENKISTNYIR